MRWYCQKLEREALYLSDNVLWDGKVLEKPKANDKETRGIIEFNKHILKDNRVDNMILTVRDGIQIIRKI